MSITLIPSIDLLDGRCVRLLQGDFEQCTVYDVDPVALADQYAQEGAEWLHVVDLAASRDGKKADIRPLLHLLDKTKQKVQTGGGVRHESDIGMRLDHGANRVVVGSIGVEQPGRLAAWLRDFGADHLVAALDVTVDAEGVPWPRAHGWTRDSRLDLWSLLDYLSEQGLKHLLCTDIGRDGAMRGPNTALYREISQRYPKLALQASGGVSSLEDLAEVADSGADAVIVGKAFLEKRFTVSEALEVLA